MKQADDIYAKLRKIRCWLLDMDGTVTLGENALPGAFPFFAAIKDHAHVFITNNSSHDKNHYLKRLKRLGFDARPDQVLTSTDALIQQLKQTYTGQKSIYVYPVGTPAFVRELSHSGIVVTQLRDQPIDAVILAF